MSDDTNSKTTRPLTIVYKLEPNERGEPQLNILMATRNGNKVVDALQEDRDARIVRVDVDS